MTCYTGESLAEFLTDSGVACEFVKMDTAPQILTYYFNLLDLKDIYKLKKVLLLLETATDETITSHRAKCGFCLEFRRSERAGYNLESQGHIMEKLTPFSILFGKDTQNNNTVATLQDLPHLLIAGTTGSGKSVAVKSYITGLCCYNKSNDLGLVLIDLKQCELNIFERLPHLITDIVTTSERAERVLEWLVDEMERRYKIMSKKGIEKNNGEFQTLLCVVDELADLVMQNESCRMLLIKLLQKARAADIHVIVATQSPRAKVLDGLMLANLPSRLALTCANYRESMLILGHGGAEKLTGSGDAILKLNGTIEEKRIQVPYIDNETIKNYIL